MKETDFLNKLNQSPLFKLSLSSKELFHSNFLWWLGNNERTFPLFKCIMEKFTGQCLSWDYGNISIEREKKHFDLCIKDARSGRLLLILENKVKSIPGLSQLENYKNKDPQADNYVLLSLVMDFPKKDEMEETDWKVYNYKDLHDALLKDVPIDATIYEKELISDYSVFIYSLHQLVQCWKREVTDDQPFVQKRNPKIEECRLHDLYDKLRFSQLALMLQNQLNHTGVDVNMGYSNQSGILDVTIKCREYELMIQVQGNSYRHACVWKSKNRKDCDTLWQQILSDKTISQLKFLTCSGTLFGSDIFQEGIYPIDNSKRGKQYNMFIGRNYVFLYQSRQLRTGITIGQLLENIRNEVENICSNITENAETLERE